MPVRKKYIPVRDDDFFTFQGNLVNIVVTNAAAWGIPAPSVAALVARRAEYEPLYLKSQDKGSRTRADVLANRQSRKLYEKEIRKFVKSWLISNDLVPDTKRVEMGLTIRDIEPTPRPKIVTFPIIGLRSVGGGSIEVRARVTTDQTRFSMHPAADAIECKFVFVPAGEMPPEDPETCPKTLVSKKARFIIPCGVKNAGQSFYGFFRWVNQSIPANSGDWTTKAQGAVIA
jgi:hypothetical protein